MSPEEYKKIEKKVSLIMERAHDPLHSLKHGLRVAANTEKITEIIGIKKDIDTNLLKVAGLIHDIPISSHGFTIIHHFLEPWFVKRDMPGILDQLSLSDKEKKIILTATINHAYSYPYRKLHKWTDPYTEVLQDADTLDLFSPERQDTFNKNLNFSLTYKEMNVFARLFFSFGKEYLAWYLNFPEIAHHLGEFYQGDPLLKDQITPGKNGKIVVLVHGFPEPIYPETPLYSYFVKRGYTVIAPYLFNPRFKLSQPEVERYVERELGGKKPDVVIGVSMGGLLAPAIAKKFPNAKLILIGTGPYIKPSGAATNLLVKVSKSHFFDILYKLIELTPTSVYSFLYKLVNHPHLSLAQKTELAMHILKNWECIKSVSEEEDKEIISFLTTIDNSILLHSLRNKTLIFAADADSMMPFSLSQKLNSLLRNSQLVINKGATHYTVFSKDNYDILTRFLNK